jgi:hypothetical protein
VKGEDIRFSLASHRRHPFLKLSKTNGIQYKLLRTWWNSH